MATVPLAPLVTVPVAAQWTGAATATVSGCVPGTKAGQSTGTCAGTIGPVTVELWRDAAGDGVVQVGPDTLAASLPLTGGLASFAFAAPLEPTVQNRFTVRVVDAQGVAGPGTSVPSIWQSDAATAVGVLSVMPGPGTLTVSVPFTGDAEKPAGFVPANQKNAAMVEQSTASAKALQDEAAHLPKLEAFLQRYLQALSAGSVNALQTEAAQCLQQRALAWNGGGTVNDAVALSQWLQLFAHEAALSVHARNWAKALHAAAASEGGLAGRLALFCAGKLE